MTLTDDQVAQLLQKLSALGFAFAGNTRFADPATRLELALREFQTYARLDFVAQESEANTAVYSDRLTAVKNTDPYTTPDQNGNVPKVHGGASQRTLDLIQTWTNNRWRCPVVVECWHVDPTTRKRSKPFTFVGASSWASGGNLWLYDDASVYGAQRPDVRVFARDFSGRLSGFDEFKQLVAADDRIPLGVHFRKNRLRWVDGIGETILELDITANGPVSMPAHHTCLKPMDALSLTGSAYDKLGEDEQKTFRIVRAIAEVECAGFFDCINAWDPAFLSLGACHWTLSRPNQQGTGGEGELEAYLAYLKLQEAQAYQTLIGHADVVPTDDWFAKDMKQLPSIAKNGQRKFTTTFSHFVLNDDGTTSLKIYPHNDAAALNFRRSWHWFYRFQIAARVVPALRRRMWDMARFRIRDVMTARFPESAGLPNIDNKPPRLMDIFTSEQSVLLLLQAHVLAPGSVIQGGRPSAKITAAVKKAVATIKRPIDKWTDKEENIVFKPVLALLQKNAEFARRFRAGMHARFLQSHQRPGAKLKNAAELVLVRNSFKLADSDLYPPPPWTDV